MKAITTLFSIVLFFLIQLSFSQVVTQTVAIENSMVPNPLWDNFTVRKSFETKTDSDEKAAIISFTFPKDKEKIFNINAGLGYTLSQKANGKHEFTGFFVYNKNTQIDKRQENYKIGITHNFVFGGDFGFINDNSIEYLNDNVEKAQSGLLVSYLSFRYNKGFPVLNSYALRESRFTYKFDPKIGLEYQNKYDTPAPLEDGYYFRGYFNVGGSFLIRKKTFKKTTTTTKNFDKDGVEVLSSNPVTKLELLDKINWKKGLELFVNYEGRNSFADNFEDNRKYQYFFKAELKIHPILNDDLAFSVSYNKGENPLDGLGKQEFWMLSLSFKK